MSQAYMFDEAVAAFTAGELRWADDDVRVALLSDSYEPEQASDRSWEEVRRFEVSPSGSYERGGAKLGGRQVVRSESGNEIRLTGNSVSWQQMTGAFRYAVLYSAERGQLIAYSDLGEQQTTEAAVNLSYGRDGVASFLIASPKGL